MLRKKRSFFCATPKKFQDLKKLDSNKSFDICNGNMPWHKPSNCTFLVFLRTLMLQLVIYSEKMSDFNIFQFFEGTRARIKDFYQAIL